MLRKCKRLGWSRVQGQAELHRHRCAQDCIRKRGYAPHNKAIGGPREHEEFEAWDDDHGIPRVFNLPNARYVGYDLWAYTLLFWGLTGTARWWIMRNQWSVPCEIWVVPTHWMRLVTGPHGVPEAWAIQSPWGNLQFAAYDDVLDFNDHSPLSIYEGWGATLMIAEWIDAYEANVRARLAQYKNGAIPAFHVSLSDEYVDPDEAMLARYYAKWFARFQGEDNTGKPLITGPGVEVKTLGISPVQMGYVDMDNQMRDNILAAFKVPKGILGLEPVSDTSAYAPARAFARFCTNPLLGMFGQRITHGLVRRTPRCERGVCFWDDRVVDDPEHDLRQMSFEAEHLAGSPNEWRTRMGKEPWPFGGDNPLNAAGEELPWATGEKPEEAQQLEESLRQASARRLELNEADADQPLIIDKDEEAPAGPRLRWHRTHSGQALEAGGAHRWRINRLKDRKGLVEYMLARDGQEVDRAGACGLLKELAERQEAREAEETVPAEAKQTVEGFRPWQGEPDKALGEGIGSAGGYLAPPRTGARPPRQEDWRLPKEGLSNDDRQKVNDEMDDVLRRRGLVLGKSMVQGDGLADRQRKALLRLAVRGVTANGRG